MVPSRSRLFAAVAAAAVLAPMLVAAPAHANRSERVAQATADAVVQRLDVMPAVAYTKYRKDLPVDDPTREAQAEQAFVSAAKERGIRKPLATRVILAQFEAAKRVQRRLIRQWTSGTRPVPDHPPADLATDLRPRIDAATNQLLDALVARTRLTAGHAFRRDLAVAQSDLMLRPALARADVVVALAPWRPIAALG